MPTTGGRNADWAQCRIFPQLFTARCTMQSAVLRLRMSSVRPSVEIGTGMGTTGIPLQTDRQTGVLIAPQDKFLSVCLPQEWGFASSQPQPIVYQLHWRTKVIIIVTGSKLGCHVLSLTFSVTRSVYSDSCSSRLE